ncbi:ESCRT-II complex subunit VPS25 [Cryptococcus wingfieldii CBS 7118]|uniref:ESCRT-II complex subunit VPS25 n=1 Tax=Cryptococcus wingfieldii CBS 7118 TaxID=1295528 RepID=A0A1E3IH36_9TREE|nr:ESCRT-II complex subunit VPS25 [Cryptococcus wingfieldii CBS 7118]ODN87735.1 ESCRT-II complex subunit VPS25 [Cryptococcus wingfieldii CBS 7118]
MSAQASSSQSVTTRPTAHGQGSSAPPTSLRPIKSASGFEFPAMWSFPPFFTLQPNPQTLAHQLLLWRNLFLEWARHERVFEVNVDSAGKDVLGVFANKGIGRRLLPPSVKTLMGELVKNGEAAPDPPKQDTHYLIYWRKPEEWGDIIYHWVMENGLNASIMTFWEITDGDLSETTEFRQLPVSILRKALESLVKRNRAQIFEGKGEAGEGVRFF